MPIRVNCPHCSAPFQVPEQMLGKAGRCSQCQKAFHLPAPKATTKEELPVVLPADEPTGVRLNTPPGRAMPGPKGSPTPRQSVAARRAAPPPTRRSGSPILLVLGLLAVGFLLLVSAGGLAVVWIVFFTGDAGPKPPIAQFNPARQQPEQPKNPDPNPPPLENPPAPPELPAPKPPIPVENKPPPTPVENPKPTPEPPAPRPMPPPVAQVQPEGPVTPKPKTNNKPPTKVVEGPKPEPVKPFPPGTTAGDKLTNRTGKNTKTLPSSFADVALGGGGRYLILHLPRNRQLAVFDTSTGEIVKYLSVAEDSIRFAAGLDKLLVYLPTANALQRYDLKTLEREATIPAPTTNLVEKMLMGSASQGPVILFCAGKGFGQEETAVLDPITLKSVGEFRSGRGGRGSTWRISGDGSLLTSYQPGTSPQGHTVHVRSGNEFKSHRVGADVDIAGHLTAGPEGRYLYSARGIFTGEGKPVGKLGAYGDGSRFCLPAAETEAFYLRIDVPDFPHGSRGLSGPLYLHLAGDERPIAKLGGVETPKELNTWGRDPFGNDRRFYLVPSAKLLVVLPTTQDRLDLYRVDVNELLAKCDHDYLTVLSSPPRSAVRGKPFTYTANVKSNKAGVTVKLDSGPAGMKVTADGKLTWDVPADFADQEASVILTVASAGGQEVFHTFSLALLDNPAPPKVAPEPPMPPRVEPPMVKVEGPPAEAGAIRPATLKEEREERALPGSIADVCVGGGGRYLVLHLAKERKLAVFDANEAKVVKYLPLTEDKVAFTAGLDKLFIAYPDANVLQRWSLGSFEKEATVPSPVDRPISNVVMGSASMGPVMVCFEGDNGGSGASFIDPKTFRVIDLNWNKGEMPSNAPELVRASANGTVFGMRCGRGGAGHDMAVITLNGKEASSQTTDDLSASLLLPTPNGRFFCTSEGVFTSELQRVHPKARERAQSTIFVPARQGDLFLQLQPAGDGFGGDEGKPMKGSLLVLLPGESRALVTLRDIEGVTHENRGNPANKMHHDKRIHLIPDAKLLVTIPQTNDRLIVRRFDLDELLAKSEVDYLFVASQPPLAVKPGEKLTYQIAVRSKKGGVKYKVEAGPMGMAVSATGQVTWSVPEDPTDKSADVILAVSDSSGQEVFHTFALAIQKP